MEILKLLFRSNYKYGLPQHKLIQDVPTRWNSAYEMLQRILEQEEAVSGVLLASGKVRDRDMMLH